MKPLEAKKSRALTGGPSFSLGNRLYRALWQVAWLVLARWTPPPLHPWRRMVLIAFGARIGKGTRVYSSATVWYPPHLRIGSFTTLGPGVSCYDQNLITIGDFATVSQGAHLCTGSHDIADPDFQLVTRPIHIGDRAWIAAEAFVGPGCVVGEGGVISARAVAFGHVEAWTVVSGNPARFLKNRHFRSPA